jgi:hypothetical protein
MGFGGASSLLAVRHHGGSLDAASRLPSVFPGSLHRQDQVLVLPGRPLPVGQRPRRRQRSAQAHVASVPLPVRCISRDSKGLDLGTNHPRRTADSNAPAPNGDRPLAVVRDRHERRRRRLPANLPYADGWLPVDAGRRPAQGLFGCVLARPPAEARAGQPVRLLSGVDRDCSGRASPLTLATIIRQDAGRQGTDDAHHLLAVRAGSSAAVF